MRRLGISFEAISTAAACERCMFPSLPCGGWPRRALDTDFLVAAHARVQADRFASIDRGTATLVRRLCYCSPRRRGETPATRKPVLELGKRSGPQLSCARGPGRVARKASGESHKTGRGETRSARVSKGMFSARIRVRGRLRPVELEPFEHHLALRRKPAHDAGERPRVWSGVRSSDGRSATRRRRTRYLAREEAGGRDAEAVGELIACWISRVRMP